MLCFKAHLERHLLHRGSEMSSGKIYTVTNVGDTNCGHGLNRREMLRRIALGATMTVGAQWVITQASGQSLRGICSRHKDPNQVGGQAVCLDQPPPIGTGLGALNYTPAVEDPMTALLIILGAILGSIPIIGPLLYAILNLMWPQRADPNTPLPDIWSLIKKQVQNLIDANIQNYYQGELINRVSGFQSLFEDYRFMVHAVANASTPTPEQINALKSKALAIQNTFELSMPQFTGIPSNGTPGIEGWKVLPLYVQAANLHITFLFDLIRNASNYGIDSEWLSDNLIVAAWKNAIDPNHSDAGKKNYLSYVATELATAMQAFEDEYKKATTADYSWTIHEFTPDQIADTTYYDQQHGGLVAAFYGPDKLRNEKVNQYTVAVKDILEAWKHLPDPSSPVPASPPTPFTINRILWCGPYGLPDTRDIGIECEYDYVDQCVGTFCLAKPGYFFVHTPVNITGGNVLVPNPADSQKTPDGLLTHIHFDEVEHMPSQNNSGGIPNFSWRLPQQHMLSWNGAPPSTGGRYNLAIDADHPVIKVNIHTCDYLSAKGISEYSDLFESAGTLIGGLEFVQENVAPYTAPPAPSRGVDWPDDSRIVGRYQQVTSNCCDGTTFPLISNKSETAAIDGHILCDIFRSSAVTKMWASIYQNSLWSVGTMMFAFRPKNPNMYPSVGILSNMYVVSPKPLMVDDIVDLGTKWYASRGVNLTASQAAQLKDAITQSISSDGLQAKRDTFWNSSALL